MNRGHGLPSPEAGHACVGLRSALTAGLQDQRSQRLFAREAELFVDALLVGVDGLRLDAKRRGDLRSRAPRAATSLSRGLKPLRPPFAAAEIVADEGNARSPNTRQPLNPAGASNAASNAASTPRATRR